MEENQEEMPLALKISVGIIMLAGVVTAGVVTWNYFKAKKDLQKGTADAKTAANQDPTPQKPMVTASGKTDFTTLPNGTTVYAVSPQSRGNLKLGQDATVAGGAEVQRLDEGLGKQGTTKLTADTNLGTIWHLGFPNTTIIRAKAGFDYPFYIVANGDINRKGSLLDKAISKIENVI